jgi:hypothetical protein
MKALIAGLLLLVACDDDIEMFPVNPGGGGGSSGTGFVDAGISDGDGGDAGNTINGRVCVLSDARFPTTCANTGAGNLMVSLGNFTATTLDNGSFTIMRPTSTNLVWHVVGDAVFPSAMIFGTSTTIPALDLGVYEDMIAASQVATQGGDGQIIAQVKRGNTPLANVTATTVPVPDAVIQYDSGSATNWSSDATGQQGVIWVPGVAGASAQLDVQEGATALEPITGIPLFPNTVTFVFAEFP